MLSLDVRSPVNQTILTREQKNARLGRIKAELSRYFGFTTDENIAEALSYAQNFQTTDATNRPLTPIAADARDTVRSRLDIHTDPELADIFRVMLDSGSGAEHALGASLLRSQNRDVRTIGSYLSSRVREAANSPEQLRKIARCVKMHYCSEANTAGLATSSGTSGIQILYPNLGSIGCFDGTEEDTILKQRIVAFRVEHPMLVPGNKNAELLSLFFNAYPTIEFTRATPVLNIRVYSDRAAIQNGRLGAMSLQKFLEGAVEVFSNPTIEAQARANEVPSAPLAIGQYRAGSESPIPDNFSTVGMEIFTAPQILVNPNTSRNNSNFLAPVIDPFRPLASIKSFDVEVRSAVGLISTKTAKLEIVLHDRSRLGEFADLVKPDRYGSLFLEIEYGWSHPDGLAANNPFADVLNLTRNKDHFNIINSSFSFDEVGQVTISLNLCTRGSSELTEVSIAGNQTRLREQLTAMEGLSREINRLSDVFGQRPTPTGDGSETTSRSGGRRQEIRGQQMLTAAGDSTSFLLLTPELFTSLRQLRETLSRRSGATEATRNAAIELRRHIDALVGTGNNQVGGALGVLQTTINQDITTRLSNLNHSENSGGTVSDPFGNDIFLAEMPPNPKNELLHNGHILARFAGTAADATTSNGQVSARTASGRQVGRSIVSSDTVVLSLGTLFMSFVAKPLAKVKGADGNLKFDEVQVYFHNFNNKAGPMSHCNISQYPIYTDFFAREYARLRLENASRAVNMTSAEFVAFLANRMVDDPMNPAYGISDLYKRSTTRETLEAKYSGDEFNRRMQTIMRRTNIGRSQDFVMPQLTMEIEALPAVQDESRTILRLHLYDKACSPNSSLRELLSLSTDNLMSTLSAYPGDPASVSANRSLARNAGSDAPSDSDLLRNWRSIHRTIIDAASRPPYNLITEIPGQNGAEPSYRFTGGPKQLKELMMQYTPHIIYGCMGTAVKNASLSSNQNSLLSTINMQRSLNSNPVEPNGEQTGGVPLSIYPVELSMTTFGCNLARYSQELFIDFNTNTTADNIYYITGLSHKIESGVFETTLKLTPNDAFGQYRNLIGQLNSAGDALRSAIANSGNGTQTSDTSSPQQRQRGRH
jgi:hypothetical protein